MNEQKRIPLSDGARYVIESLEAAGYRAYAVGGCVRDALLGSTPSDYDVTTSALPYEVCGVFTADTVIPTGIKHGTVTVLACGEPIEVTTFRIDGSYTDRRKPDSVRFCRTLGEDLSRRDFTIGAIAYSECEGIIDPYGGRADIEKRVIRCVGDPHARLSEDALRILRALRFSAVLGFSIEPETDKALRELAPLLTEISAERCREELLRLLCGRDAVRVMREYISVIGVIIPELLPMVGFDQKNIHHIYDVYEHTLHVLGGTRPIPVLRLSALFHDIGKPDCYELGADGQGHFRGHPERSTEIASGIMHRLRFDGETMRQVLLLVRWHDRQIEETERAVRRALNKLGRDIFFLLLELKVADNLAQSPAYRDRKRSCEVLDSIAEEIIERGDCTERSRLAMNGSDLIALGMHPGREIGTVLDSIFDSVLSGELPTSRTELIAAAKQLLENADSAADGITANGTAADGQQTEEKETDS